MSIRRQYRVAAGILRQGGSVLLVLQQGPKDAAPVWSLPGGVLEEGELFGEALAREVREETGLQVLEVGRLAYLVQLDSASEGCQSVALVHEIVHWRGTLGSQDPDALVQAAEFVPWEEAVRRLGRLPWRHLREPAIAYLSSSPAWPRTWQYRQGADGGQHLVQRT